eukprot:2021601-Pleurochrysis_carterae.AAC.1
MDLDGRGCQNRMMDERSDGRRDGPEHIAPASTQGQMSVLQAPVVNPMSQQQSVSASLAMGNMPQMQQPGIMSQQSRLQGSAGPPVMGGGMMPQQSMVERPPPSQMGGSLMAQEPSLMAPQQGPITSSLQMGGVPPPQPPPSSQPSSQSQPFRQLKVEDALAYLDQVKMKFEKQPHIYNQVAVTPP